MLAKVEKEVTLFIYQTNQHLQKECIREGGKEGGYPFYVPNESTLTKKKCICKLQKYVTQGITFAINKCLMYLMDTFIKTVHEICNS